MLGPAELWRCVRDTEQASSHPIALAITQFAQDKLVASSDEQGSPSTLKIIDIQEVPGRGMLATMQKADGHTREVLIGNEKMLLESGANVPEEIASTLRGWQDQGKSVVLVGVKNTSGKDASVVHLAAVVAVADPLRPEAAFVLDYFRQKGIGVYIVSGDGPATVKAVARTLNLPESQIVGGALPDDKRRFVQDLQEQRKKVRGWNGQLQEKRKLVAFVGDGINDSIGRCLSVVNIC